jgi:hypothetical protein
MKTLGINKMSCVSISRHIEMPMQAIRIESDLTSSLSKYPASCELIAQGQGIAKQIVANQISLTLYLGVKERMPTLTIIPWHCSY